MGRWILLKGTLYKAPGIYVHIHMYVYIYIYIVLVKSKKHALNVCNGGWGCVSYIYKFVQQGKVQAYTYIIYIYIRSIWVCLIEVSFISPANRLLTYPVYEFAAHVLSRQRVCRV